MDTCITYGNTADEETVESKFKIGCNSFLGEDVTSKHKYIDICENFKYLFHLLFGRSTRISTISERSHDYINY